MLGDLFYKAVHRDEIEIKCDETIIKIKDALKKSAIAFVSGLVRISERKTIRLRRLPAHNK